MYIYIYIYFNFSAQQTSHFHILRNGSQPKTPSTGCIAYCVFLFVCTLCHRSKLVITQSGSTAFYGKLSRESTRVGEARHKFMDGPLRSHILRHHVKESRHPASISKIDEQYACISAEPPQRKKEFGTGLPVLDTHNMRHTIFHRWQFSHLGLQLTADKTLLCAVFARGL